MEYVKITNGNVVKYYENKPNYPVQDSSPTPSFYQTVELKDFSEWSFDSENNVCNKEYNITIISYDDKKAQMLNSIAGVRYEKETSGIIINGNIVATDRGSQAMLHSALRVVRDNPSKIIQWKTMTGWINLDSTSVEYVSQCVINYIEDCFNNEHSLWVAIIDSTESTLENVDIESGWPNRTIS